ncbi:hypothetical protein [Arthrobacter sp. CAL618]|uniref:hypothetical protein n=1 Tax=Arthrobacter sp. CAL618 TaxID=1055770 RepID=UPI0003F6663A|nr:hypothetical protein [Arthrobacter sp. CAL618]
MSDVSPDENHRNPFTRPGFIISAALVLALMAAVIVIAFIPRGGDEPDAGSTEPTTTETTSAPTATADGVEESICGLPSSGETALGTAPESDWELVGTIAAPTSPEQHGPGVVSDGVRSCFSNDVTGALYAAVNIAALAGLGEEEKLYSELSVPSPAQQQALENASTSPANNSISVQIAGFQIDSYTEESAVVRLGIRGSNGVNLNYPVPLEWHEGDWKLVVPPTGDTGVREVPDLTDFISWSGA